MRNGRADVVGVNLYATNFCAVSECDVREGINDDGNDSKGK